MEPSTLAASPRPAKPPGIWVVVTLVAGAVGSLGAVAAGGSGTYDVAPFKIELRARPAPLGKTELAVRPEPAVPLLPREHAEAGTHRAPLLARATIVGITPAGLAPSDTRVLSSPYQLASFIGEEGQDAVRRFAIKLALLAIAGGAAGGLLVSFGRWRRVIGGLIAGVLTFAIIGVLVQQTYDTGEFKKTRFVLDRDAPGQQAPNLPTVLPT